MIKNILKQTCGKIQFNRLLIDDVRNRKGAEIIFNDSIIFLSPKRSEKAVVRFCRDFTFNLPTTKITKAISSYVKKIVINDYLPFEIPLRNLYNNKIKLYVARHFLHNSIFKLIDC